MQFAADLQCLWTDRPMDAAINAAAQAGFVAIELGTLAMRDLDAVVTLKDAWGLPVLCVTTSDGSTGTGRGGRAAVPGEEAAAGLAIDQAIAQAVVLGAPQVHVTAGRGHGPAAYDTLLANLDYACTQAALHGLKVLIGPQNSRDLPGSFLNSLTLCRQAMRDLSHNGLRLMFDCYEVARTDGDLTGNLSEDAERIGLIRFAGVPDRGAPDRGEVNYAYIFRHIEAMGWDAPLSASYRPASRTELSLSWMRRLRPQVIRPWQLAASAGR